jgi:sigma-B regulation protein RsbU (phosphoserine phosphatase)
MRRTAANNLALGLGLAAVALLGILPLSHRMTRHLSSLTDGAERLAAGDLGVRVPVPHGREFRRLAETFNRLARDLRENQEKLLEQERLRKELEIGRRIQEELLPRGPLLSPFAEVGGVSIPAREVGGDFFNYFPLDDDEVAILVGDVSGKGVPAALLMASLQATIRARLGLERDLTRLVAALDHEMGSEKPLAPYYTLFLAVLEGKTGRLRYVNAGHNTQLVLRADGGVEPLSSTGRPPGLYPGGGYEEGTAVLRAGDALFLFTDGLVEAEDETGEPFGMSRLEALLRVHPSHDLAPLLGVVDAAARAHRGPVEAADDATMVALRFSGVEPARAGA